MSHIPYTISRSGCYYYNRRVPKHAVKAYGKFIRVALSRCPQESEEYAKRLSYVLEGSWRNTTDIRPVDIISIVESYKPRTTKLSEIAEEFLEFIEGSTLVIHNAPFDVGFLNNEINLVSSKLPKLEDICEIEDSLLIARDKFPGQRNSLDALANRFEVTGYDRSFHGALLDANILADVFMMLTGGQSKFEFMNDTSIASAAKKNIDNALSVEGIKLIKLQSTDEHDKNHSKRLSEISEKHSIETI